QTGHKSTRHRYATGDDTVRLPPGTEPSFAEREFGDYDTGIGPNMRVGAKENWYEITHTQKIRFVGFSEGDTVTGEIDPTVADATIDRALKRHEDLPDRAIKALAHAESPEHAQLRRGAAERAMPVAYQTFGRIDGERMQAGVYAMLKLQGILLEIV